MGEEKRNETGKERKGKGREGKARRDRQAGRQGGREGGRVRTVDAGNGSDSEALGRGEGGLSELHHSSLRSNLQGNGELSCKQA